MSDTANVDQLNKTTKCTLFLRNLPASCSSVDLETYFSRFGPVRSAFPVARPGSTTGNIGFVHFATAEDARKALSFLQSSASYEADAQANLLMGRKIAAEMALRKGAPKPARGIIRKDPSIPKKNTLVPKKKQAHGQASPHLIISLEGNLPLNLNEKQIYKKYRKVGKLQKVTFPLSKEKPRCARLTFSTAKEAQKAARRIDGHTFKGCKISLVQLDSIVETKSSHIKSHRLIIRNLPFHVDKSKLEERLGEFGKVVELSLPLKPDGTTKGFAFVQYAELSSAKAFMEKLNGNELLGRMVAIDFAVSKQIFLQQTATDKEIQSSEHIEASSDEPVNSNAGSFIEAPSSQQGPEEEDEADEMSRTIFIRNVPFSLNEAQLSSLLEQSFGKLCYCKLVKDFGTGASRGTAFAQFSSSKSAKAAISASLSLQNTSNANETRSALDDGLGIFLSDLDSKLDNLAKARTGKQFSPAHKDSDSLIKPSTALVDVENGLIIDGRALVILPALSKKQIKAQDSNSQFLDSGRQDRRNLHLIMEARVRPKTIRAQEFWPPMDISYRESLIKGRRKELSSNPNFYISKTRLSLRHLPLSIEEKHIKQVLYAAVSQAMNGYEKRLEGHPIISHDLYQAACAFKRPYLKQVKIVRDPIRNRSKGYGFAEFTSHEHALLAVRYLTNYCPSLWRENWPEFMDLRRHKSTHGTEFKPKVPIVEFATENQHVVKKREAKKRERLD